MFLIDLKKITFLEMDNIVRNLSEKCHLIGSGQFSNTIKNREVEKNLAAGTKLERPIENRVVFA